jgi:RNA polymerase sigma-70 factor (ECF subfamily)
MSKDVAIHALLCNPCSLIQRILTGDEAAFAELVRQYQGAVFALAYHYVKDFQDAQEIAQDVFIKVYRNLSTLNDPLRFSNWLRKIVYNEAMMRLRTRRKSVATYPLEAESPEMISRSIQQYTDAQRRDAVMEALNDLPEDLRLLVELRYLGGYNSQEIAKLLEMKPGTVRYRLHNAIKSLKEEFQMVEKEFQSQQLPEDFAGSVLKSLGRLKGRVISIEGKPLGNIKLDLDQLLPENREGVSSKIRGIFSSNFIHVDADGTFSVDIPNWSRHRADEADTGEFHIGLYGMVGGAVRHADANVTLKIGEQANDIVLDLREKPYQLRVGVVDSEGQPVEGAKVAFHLRYPDRGGHGFIETYDGKEMHCFQTNAEGFTPMLHLSGFDYQFEITAENFKKYDWPDQYIKVPEEIPEDGILEIQLEEGGRIAGRVVDSKGAPVANAKIAIRSYKFDQKSWGSGRYINLSYTAPDDVFTDAEGRFAFTTLESVGFYSLHAYREGYGVDCLLDVPVGTDDAIFHLMPVVSLCGTILKDSMPNFSFKKKSSIIRNTEELRTSKPVVILEKDFEAYLENTIRIDFVESKGAYAKFNDRRIQPYKSCKIRIFTDESGVFRVDYLFPGATYKLTIPFEGKEYVRTVTLGEDVETYMTIELD